VETVLDPLVTFPLVSLGTEEFAELPRWDGHGIPPLPPQLVHHKLHDEVGVMDGAEEAAGSLCLLVAFVLEDSRPGSLGASSAPLR